MISAGQKIDTAFTLKIVRDGVVREEVFQDLLTRPTLVSVYMKNSTGSCDRQISALAAHAGEFDKLGFNVVALSRDTAGSHQRYALKNGINFPLVSDPGDRFAQATDSIVEKAMYGRTFHGPQRAAYLFATDGTVLAVIEKVDTKDHGAQIHGLLASLR